jgi:glycosyltransferase involved in cell wall biosynthesis
MKEVFHIISHFDLGGAEMVAFDIASSPNPAIRYHLIEVQRGSSDYTPKFIADMQNIGIRYHRSWIPDIHFHYIFERIAMVFFPLWFIFIYLKYRPSVIHVHTELPDQAIYYFLKLFPWTQKQFRLIRTIHNTVLWTGRKRKGMRIEHQLFQPQHANVAISDLVRDQYQREFGATAPIIYNGISAVSQLPFENIRKGKINVLFAGRMEQQKGISTLTDIIVNMKDDERYFFHVIGKGPLQHQLQQALEGCRNVAVYPVVYHLSSYLASFDYLLMPSVHEGLSILAMEAGIQRLPDIINDCAGLKDVLPDDWPLKVHDNDLMQYLQLFREVLPTADKKALGNQAYQYVNQHYSLQRMQQQYEQIYLQG